MPDRACPSCSRPSDAPWRCPACGGLLETKGFLVERLLALSPYTRVYRARGPTGPVALKELVYGVVPDVKSIERFEREGRVLRELSHPRIPSFVEAFTDGEGPQVRLYLAQQFVPGASLEEELKSRRYNEAEARRIAAEILEVLGYLHTRSPGLVHRDVKPGNVIARSDGGYALVDFGSVRDLGSSQRPSGAGTFEYMPPEQLQGEVDGRADLYALGATLVRLLSRRQPSELRNHELELSFRPWVNVSEPFAQFLDGLVARSRNDRFPTAARAAAVLASLPPLDPEPKEGVRLVRRPTQVIPTVEEEAPPAAPNPAGRHVFWVRSRTGVEVEPRGKPWLLTLPDGVMGLRPGAAYVVGRSSEADIRVDDAWPKADTVSRKHARLILLEDGLRVDDLDSRNGTWVGTMRILPHQIHMLIHQGAPLQLGKLVLFVEPWVGLER